MVHSELLKRSRNLSTRDFIWDLMGTELTNSSCEIVFNMSNIKQTTITSIIINHYISYHIITFQLSTSSKQRSSLLQAAWRCCCDEHLGKGKALLSCKFLTPVDPWHPKVIKIIKDCKLSMRSRERTGRHGKDVSL